jgi:pimeloyl-ACP methyl ester carboxylesterase
VPQPRASATTAQVEVAGRALEVLDLPGESGSSPLVLLHEGLGSVGLWREFPALLHTLTGRRLIAFSRFGHGRSAPPPEPRTPAFFHDEALDVLPALLRGLDVTNPVLVGHSDGASIALIHAAHEPVASLVLIAPHVFVEEITLAEIRLARQAFADGDLRDRMARHHDDPEAAFRGWCDVWLDPEFETWSLEQEAHSVTAPTLLIQGADDPYGTLEQLARIKAGARGRVDCLVVPGGHSPHLEHPHEVAKAIAAFAGRSRQSPVRAGADGAARST